MKKKLAVLLLGCAWSLPVSADNIDQVGKLFVELNYEYTFAVNHVAGLWPWQVAWTEWPVEEQQDRRTGSFWAVQTPDKTILITAAHVLGVNWRPTEIGGHKLDADTAFVRNVTARVLVGTLAYELSDVGVVSGVNDAVFLTVKDSRMLRTIKPLVLSDSDPETGGNVQVWGYPSTDYQQGDTTLSITAVRENGGFFILNKAVKDGYSGGVVLNSKGTAAYGVIINTGDEQTTALRITPEMLKAIVWHPASEMLNHSF